MGPSKTLEQCIYVTNAHPVGLPPPPLPAGYVSVDVDRDATNQLHGGINGIAVVGATGEAALKGVGAEGALSWGHGKGTGGSQGIYKLSIQHTG